MRLTGVKLEAIADPSADARRQVSSHLHVPAHADWRELLGKIDVVSVCSPASTHAEIVRAFLLAGSHVLVEKPIATDLDEADELIELAANRKLILTVGHQERFVFAKSGLLDQAEAPLFVECVRRGPWTGRGSDVSVVLDLMIHDLDLLHRLVPGVPLAVSATGHAAHGRLMDDVTADLVFPNGTRARLTASRAAEQRERSMRAVYRDGEVEIDFLARTVKNTTKRALKPLELHDPLAEAISAFVSAAQFGSEPLVRPQEARSALATALEIEAAMLPVVAVLRTPMRKRA